MKYRFWRAMDTLGHKYQLPFRKWICGRFDEVVMAEFDEAAMTEQTGA